jgi:hypothetical protein
MLTGKNLLQFMVDLGEKHARNILLERHEPELSPIMHFVNARGQHQIVTLVWSDDTEKLLAMAGARNIAHAMNATAMMFMDEMWRASYKMQKEYVRPAERPDRREVVLAVATDGIDQVAREWQIVRTRPGGPIMALVDSPLDGMELKLAILEGILPKKGAG